jgi:hypothetical protein
MLKSLRKRAIRAYVVLFVASGAMVIALKKMFKDQFAEDSASAVPAAAAAGPKVSDSKLSSARIAEEEKEYVEFQEFKRFQEQKRQREQQAASAPKES